MCGGELGGGGTGTDMIKVSNWSNAIWSFRGKQTYIGSPRAKAKIIAGCTGHQLLSMPFSHVAGLRK